AKNLKENERRRQFIEDAGVAVTDDALLRVRLWEDLAQEPQHRCCPYTGQPIGIAQLLSDAVEIDHILPFSRTLDDSIANKIVCLRQANRDKGNRTPWGSGRIRAKTYACAVYCRTEIRCLAEAVGLVLQYARGKRRAKSLSGTVSPAARNWATILARCTVRG